MDAPTVIIPCYNEAERLRPQDFLDALDAWPDLRLHFVDDGSVDATFALLERLDHPRATVQRLRVNGGKGAAVRAGVHYALGTGAPVIGWWDADLATPLSEIRRFHTELFNAPHRVAVIGARIQLHGNHVRRRTWRHYAGRIAATAASHVLHMPVYDTQCGAKLLRADAAEVAFQRPFLTRWMFDVEVLARLRDHLGDATHDAIREIIVDAWAEVAGSKVGLKDVLRVPLDLARIARAYPPHPERSSTARNSGGPSAPGS